MRKSGSSNLIDSIKNSVGISDQNDCSICGARGISLNQLPNGYTTLMIDGIPIFSSFAGVYGLDMIDTNGVSAIEVSRGAGVSVIAPEALAGTVNLVTKRPEKDMISGQTIFGNYGTQEVMLYGAKVFKGGAVSFAGSSKERKAVDSDNNGISESASYERKSMSVSLFLDDVAGFKTKSTFLVASDYRHGGATIEDLGIIKTDTTGNPFQFGNTHKGDANYVYNGGYAGLTENINTDRKQITSTAEKKTSFGSVRFAVGLAEHMQDSFYSGDIYDAKQNQTYLENSYKINFQTKNPTELTIGLNHMYQDLKSLGRVAGMANIVNGIDNFNYNTLGTFVKICNSFFEDKLETTLSARFDRQNEYGNIITPRFNAMLKHNENLTSRVSVGTGYRVPTSYFEFEHGILSAARISRNIEDVERSKNASYSLAYMDDRVHFVGGYNFTKIENIAHITIDDVTGDGIFESSQNPVIVQNVDFTAGYLFTPRLMAKLGFEYNHFNFTQGDLPIARPTRRILLAVDKDITSKIATTFRANWTGSQDLEKFYGERFNIDGSRKSSKSPHFFTFDALVNFKIKKGHSVILGVNNITNYVQSDRDSQIFLDNSGNLDVINIWGPNVGRYIYVNYKFDIE